MLETLRMDYIRTARSKGLTEAEVIRKHALRNALLPVVTVVALSFRLIFSGAVITEKVFAYQGVGSLMFDSIMANDFNVAMCCFLMICLAVLLMNLLADVLYAYLDPRITYQ
jgi:peptide/nickel transport system permease protein